MRSFVEAYAVREQPRRPGGERVEAGDLEGFLSALTDLSHSYGLAVSGAPELFLMERDDYAYAYVCDADGRLVRR